MAKMLTNISNVLICSNKRGVACLGFSIYKHILFISKKQHLKL